MKKLVLFLLLLPSVFACITPENNMQLQSSAELCNGVYFLDDGISIMGDNIHLDCSGALLKTWKSGRGISIEHSTNVTVTDCRLVNYNIGLYARNSSNILLIDNYLIRNNIGTRFVVVSDSATLNHDVSLETAFEIFESEHNILSLLNKRVSGDICNNNFCNEPRSSILLFMEPETDLQPWLHGSVTGLDKLKELHNWIFGDLTSR